MPKLKDTNTPKKVECSIFLTPTTKSILASAALELKIKQSDIVENMIINLHNQKKLFSSIDYIEKREKLFTEMVHRIQEGLDYSKKFDSHIYKTLDRYDQLMVIIENQQKSIDTFKVDLIKLIEGKFNSL